MAFEEVIGSVMATIWQYKLIIMMTLFMAFNHWKSKQPFPESGGNVKAVHGGKAEFDALLAKNKFVLVDFYATWCPPCRSAAQPFGQLSLKYTGATFVKVDVDEW
jgi:thiol-disulfide isomerase/thioredoxin